MIYTEKTKKAIKFCFEAHKDQTDKSGMPYVHHPFHLAEQMQDEDTTIVALLHDVCEDTKYTLEDIKKEVCDDEKILEALALLTHDPDVKYEHYVAAIKPNPIARAVKIADLMHNSDTTRLDEVDEKAIERLKRYREAYKMLTE
jgi:(p)ppGpp synthase/HD superfamily hydrolase